MGDFIEAGDDDYFTPRASPKQSVCEVLRERGWPEVGVANVFYSHPQGKWLRRTVDCMRQGCDAYRSRLGGKSDDEVFFWLDYMVLRQCVNDFDVKKVIATIGGIGCTMIELDIDPQFYLKRTFCMLETYATVVGKAKMLMTVNLVRAMRMREELQKAPVKAEESKCWSEEEKKRIKESEVE